METKKTYAVVDRFGCILYKLEGREVLHTHGAPLITLIDIEGLSEIPVIKGYVSIGPGESFVEVDSLV
jgi:hypothetical protein